MTFLAVVSSLCWAQSPEGPPTDPVLSTAPLTFNADSVLITTFQPLDDASGPDAERLFALVVERLTQNNEVVSMAKVPRFEPQGYEGADYMKDCPPSKYGGCALVLGQRAGSDRALGATLRREEDEFDAGSSLTIMTVYIVDVLEAREVASFGVPIDPQNEAAAIMGIARVFDDVVKGDYELRDMRERGETPDDAALEEARRERLALTLSELEDQIGMPVRSDTVRAPRQKISEEDLAKYEDRDETPPWERVGMSQQQYIRFVNSGEDLDDWRSSGWGRFGKVTARLMAGFGNGPWHEAYKSEVLLSSTTLQPAQSVQYLELQNASSAAADLEIGFGVAPFADISFATSIRNGQLSYSAVENVQGQVARPGSELRYGMSSVQYGARAQISPFPRWPVRPTVGAGVAYWSGKGVPATDRFERLAAPNAVLFEIIPGVEADASPWVAFSLRFLESIPVGGTFVRTTSEGEPLMESPPTPTRDYGAGLGLQAGILVRIPVLKPPAPKREDPFMDDP